MKTTINPYINFKGNAREAITFYQSVFGGKLSMFTFKEFGASSGPDYDDQIMHASVELDNGFSIMVSDLPAGMELASDSRIQISLNGDDAETLRGYYEKLSKGGQVLQALAAADWGDEFGMFNDKFGIGWMVNISTST